jgi:predicted membrane protein
MSLLYVVLVLIIVAVVARYVNTYIPISGNTKTILNVVLALIGVGLVLWLINTYVPMAGSIKAILNIVVVLATCVKILQALGLWNRTVSMVRSMWHNLTKYRTPIEDRPLKSDDQPLQVQIHPEERHEAKVL